MKIIDNNKKAYFDYFIEETIEAGIVLAGSEVKSIAAGHVNLRDSFCQIDNGEAWLKNCHITPYDKGSFFNEDAKRNRKLLLHKAQIDKIIGKIKTKGYTLVPTKIYFSANRVKIEIGLAKGKQNFDKRAVLKEKEVTRTINRELKNY